MPRVAHIFALAGVLSVSTAVCRPESIHSSNNLAPEKTLVIFLTSDSAIAPAVSSRIKQELSHLLEGASIRVEWQDPVVDRGGAENDFAAVVHLRGACHPTEPDTRFEHAVSGPFPLASSAVADGVILPFGDIDCAALNSFLGPSLWGETEQKREFVYDRAVARLMAHELYHMVAQTHVHARSGVAEPAFTVAELLSAHFEFTDSALAELHTSTEADRYSVWTDSGDASGK